MNRNTSGSGPADPPADVARAAITRIIDHQRDAWNRGDAAEYARDCDPEMSFTNIESRMFFGRDLFEERHRFLFEGQFAGSRLDMTIKRIWLPTEDVAIVDVGCTLAGYRRLPDGVMPQQDGRLHTNLMEVLIRAGSTWRVVAYHNVDV